MDIKHEDGINMPMPSSFSNWHLKKETLPSLGTLKGQAEDKENILQT